MDFNTFSLILRTSVCCISILFTSVQVQAQQVQKIMSVGHSLLGPPEMPSGMIALAADAGIPLIANKTQNIPGSPISLNWSEPERSEINYKDEFASTVFDVFILTEAQPVNSNRTYNNGDYYANLFYGAAIANNPAIKFYMWQTWQCIESHVACSGEGKENGLIGQIIRDRAEWIGFADTLEANNPGAVINIIPGGEAMIALDAAIKAGQVDGISSIEQIFNDHIHLNDIGWYYMALVNYAAVFKSNPLWLTSNIPGEIRDYTPVISTSAVATLQRIAWNTVCNYPRSGVPCGEPDDDNDGLSNAEEAEVGTDPQNPDTDGDTMPDGYEVANGLEATIADGVTDSDGDSFTNIEEYEFGTDPNNSADYPSSGEEGLNQMLTIGTGEGSSMLSDGVYTLSSNTSDDAPTPQDNYQFSYTLLPGDGELTVHMDSFTASIAAVRGGLMIRSGLAQNSDMAFVGLSRHGTFFTRRDATNGAINSWDGNGWLINTSGWLRLVRTGNTVTTFYSRDGVEWTENGSITLNLNRIAYVGLAVAANNGGGLSSASFSAFTLTAVNAALDDDNDGLSNVKEVTAGTDPENPDTDGDGLQDGAEVNTWMTNPLAADTDGDTMPDGYEVANGLVATVADGVTDSDGDGFSNIAEYEAGTDPNSGVDYPNAPPIATLPGCAADRAAAKAHASTNPYSYTGSLSMGSNLSPFAYWESSYPFVDLRRQSDHIGRELGSWNITGGTGTLDANRNISSLPTGTASKGLVLDAQCLYGGDYVVLWNPAKSPEVSLTHFGAGTLTLVTDEKRNGRRVYNLNLPEGLTETQYRRTNLSVAISAPITGNVDYHVLLPGTESIHDAGGLFNPDFVEDLSNNDVLRFMDWFATNDSDKTDIADLPRMDWDTWAYDKGVPYGVAMKLVKEADVPIAWITIPHLATPATMAEIARQVYAEWEEGIVVYIEFSNEVWNHGFAQTWYAESQGPIVFPSLDGVNAQSTWLAHKSIEMKQAFIEAFGSDASAIKLVVAGHVQEGGYVNDTDLDFCFQNCRLRNQYNDIENQIDVYAIAPYMFGSLQGPDYATANNVVSWTDAQLYSHINANSDPQVTTDIESIITQLGVNKAKINVLTGRTDVELAVYEFGQHLAANHDPNSALDVRYRNFQVTPEMGALYHSLIQAMITAGVSTAANFNLHGQHGAGFYWGSKQGVAGTISPRHQALEAAY